MWKYFLWKSLRNASSKRGQSTCTCWELGADECGVGRRVTSGFIFSPQTTGLLSVASRYLFGCGWYLVLICCKKLILLADWYWFGTRKTLLVGCSRTDMAELIHGSWQAWADSLCGRHELDPTNSSSTPTASSRVTSPPLLHNDKHRSMHRQLRPRSSWIPSESHFF